MNKQKISWEDAQTFLAVIEHNSFSAAARAMGLGQPTISRRIAHLELLMSQQLFIRGKQGAAPTTAALSLLPAAEQMAKWAAEFDRTAKSHEVLVSGTVTIAAPPGIAVEQLAPFAKLLRRLEPDIRLEILAAIDHVDLTRGSADLALRTHFPNEPELTVVHTFISQPGVYASAAYAAAITQPCSWADLDWVTWAGKFRDVAPRPMLEKLMPNFEPSVASDDYLVQKAAVILGLGAFVAPKPMGFQEDDLVTIDVGVTLPEHEIYLVCAKSMQHVPRIKAVVAHMVSCLAGEVKFSQKSHAFV
jgi:DNA-binding transcriptional LysR family regulator